MRLWSYVYFVPNIFAFGVFPPDGPFSAEFRAGERGDL
jgi:hypothetical protein